MSSIDGDSRFNVIKEGVPNHIESDEGAKDEEKDLEKERDESTKRHVHYIIITGLYLYAATVAILFITHILLMVLPEHCRWIKGNDITLLELNLTRLIAAGLAIPYIKRYLENRT